MSTGSVERYAVVGTGAGPVTVKVRGLPVAPSVARSTVTLEPSVSSPPISSVASGFCTCFWIARRSGRAPYCGSQRPRPGSAVLAHVDALQGALVVEQVVDQSVGYLGVSGPDRAA